MPKQTAISLSDITDKAIRHHLANRVYSNAAVAIGSTAANVANGSIDYSINGIIYNAAANAVGVALPATLPVIPVASTAWYLLVIDKTGATTFVPGIVDSGQTDGTTGLPLPITGSFAQNAFGPIPLNTTVYGAVKVVTDATHTFTPGTTALNATGITSTFFTLSCVPAADLLAAGNTGSLDLPS